jgi:hypothetical protein
MKSLTLLFFALAACSTGPKLPPDERLKAWETAQRACKEKHGINFEAEVIVIRFAGREPKYKYACFVEAKNKCAKNLKKEKSEIGTQICRSEEKELF